mmetsp:Transcript_12561/g.22553  ORF Transcript_12561/g.22553 Transcript_12561/m.22553 type:complete len:813 (+) Transcript_12561:1-2439(+)
MDDGESPLDAIGNAQKPDTSTVTKDTDSTNNNDNQDFLSTLLIAIMASVGAAIVAVMCFVYCLMCRNGRFRKNSFAIDDDEEDDDDMEQLKKNKTTPNPAAIHSYSNRASRRSRNVDAAMVPDVPAVTTIPTDDIDHDDDDDDDDVEHGNHPNRYHYPRSGSAPNYNSYPESEISASVVGYGDDGVSDMDMDTLPPPTPTDNDYDMGMSVMDYEEGILPNTYGNTNYHDNDDAISDAGTSLYSYIPDDTSLAMYNTNESITNHKNSSRAPFSSAYSKVSSTATAADSNNNYKEAGTTMEQTKQKGLLWSVMDTLKKYGNDTDNEADMYLEDSKDNNNDVNTIDQESLTDDDNASLLRDVGRRTRLLSDDQESATVTSVGDDSLLRKDKKEQFENLWKDDNDDNDDVDIGNKENKDDDDNKDNNDNAEEDDQQQVVTPVKASEGEAVEPTPKTEKRRNGGPSTKETEPSSVVKDDDEVIADSDKEQEANDDTNKSVNEEGAEDANEAPTNDANTEDEQEENVVEEEIVTKATPTKSLVDWVPRHDDDVEDYDEEDAKRFLPLPTALETSFKEANKAYNACDNEVSSLSSMSGASSATSGRKVESARKKKPSKWGTQDRPQLEFSHSCDDSVSSTDSAAFRSLLGQSDTNDAALVFSKQQQQELVSQREEGKSKNSNSDPEGTTPHQLQSLLDKDTADGFESAEEFDDAEELLLEAEKQAAATVMGNSETASNQPTRSQDIMRKSPAATTEEEKKDDFSDEEHEGEKKNPGYLPASILPAASYESTGDGTIVSTSSLSAAPSVDASISSKMGWF